MTLDAFDAVLFTVIFLIPGFVFRASLSMFLPRRAVSPEVQKLEFLTLSCLNNALWIWLLVPLFVGDYLHSHPLSASLALLMPVLISPTVLALAIGRSCQRTWATRFLGVVGIRLVRVIPTAWDYYFSRELASWVIVTLRDSSHVYGKFGAQSFAGDDPAERDLYLEAQYRLSESGAWLPVDSSGGILLKADQIATIEFIRMEGVNYARGDNAASRLRR
jgi:hypothetical protein